VYTVTDESHSLNVTCIQYNGNSNTLRVQIGWTVPNDSSIDPRHQFNISNTPLFTVSNSSLNSHDDSDDLLPMNNGDVTLPPTQQAGRWLSTVLVHIFQNTEIAPFKSAQTNDKNLSLDLSVNQFYDIQVDNISFLLLFLNNIMN